MWRNFGFKRIVPADQFSPYERDDVLFWVAALCAWVLILVGLGIFIA